MQFSGKVRLPLSGLDCFGTMVLQDAVHLCGCWGWRSGLGGAASSEYKELVNGQDGTYKLSIENIEHRVPSSLADLILIIRCGMRMNSEMCGSCYQKSTRGQK